MGLSVKNVLISDKVDICCKEYFEAHGVNVAYKPGITKDELKSIIKDYDGLIVRSATKVTSDIFEVATNLKIVGRAGTGVDNIDLPSATRNGVLVMNTPGGNTLSAAEHTCALISALSRHVGQGYSSLLNDKWERSKFMGNELMGKTLAIIGLGRIGREVAYRMQSFGMKTVGYDPIVSKEEAEALNIKYLSLAEIWPVADFITVHVPLIPPTKGMVNTKVFDLCKRGVRVINVARGGIIDEHDLLTALNDGRCGGAALDVFTSEPPKDISLELVKHPKVLATPHLGASTSEAQIRVAKEIAEQIIDGNNGKPMFGLVNAPALSESGNPVFRPWIQAAEKLGKIVGNILESNKDLNLSISGSPLKTAVKLLTTAFAYGVAQCSMKNSNMINAMSLLKEGGTTITSRYVETSDEIAICINVNGLVHTQVTSANSLPLLVTFSTIDLATPISLNHNLVCMESTTQAPRKLLEHLDGTEITSFSSGTNGALTVAVATLEGVIDTSNNNSYKFIEL